MPSPNSLALELDDEPFVFDKLDRVVFCCSSLNCHLLLIMTPFFLKTGVWFSLQQLLECLPRSAAS